jgi:hypothetical protein
MGVGMGFDPFFYPSGLNLSFAVSKPESLNPRAIAVKKFIAGEREKIVDPIFSWDGPWQSE